MNKLNFLNKELENGKLSEKDLKVVLFLYKADPYISLDEIAKNVKLDKIDVVFVLQNLCKTEPVLVHNSQGLYILTAEGDDVVEKSADNWFVANNPDYSYSYEGRVKREILKTQENFKDHVINSFDDGYFSNVKITRQNYKCIIADKSKGIKSVEIRNNNKIRVVIGKSEKEIIEKFNLFDGVFMPASPAAYVCRYEYECTNEILNSLITNIKSI